MKTSASTESTADSSSRRSEELSSSSSMSRSKSEGNIGRPIPPPISIVPPPSVSIQDPHREPEPPDDYNTYEEGKKSNHNIFVQLNR